MSSIFKKIAVGLFLAQSASAQTLTPQSFFNRCYTQLTGTPVPLNHSLMNKVKAGEITALNACIEILHKGELTKNGPLVTPGDPESRAVLRTFQAFHRTWFPSNNINSLMGYSSSEQNGTPDIYDASEAALALTFSVFGPGQKYSDVLTRSTGVHALRSEDPVIAARMGWKSNHPGRFLKNDPLMGASLFTFRATDTTATLVSRNINKHVSTKLAMPNIEVGDLIGIRPTSETFKVPNISLQPLGNSTMDKASLYADKLNYSYDFFKPMGGGVMGFPIYILQNLGHGFNMKFNGQTKVPRRWSQTNMNSFLCANLPTLRESDVQQFLSTSSSAPFRNSTSCLMCHATLDPMAYTLRNVTVGTTDFFLPNKNGDDVRDADGKIVLAPLAYVRNAVAMTTYKALHNSIAGWPAEPVTDFHLQKPTGRLYFRSATGTLVDKQVADLAALGKAMTETDDYYLCAAKRYFEFMTGIQVSLYDRTNPKNSEINQALTAEDIENRKFVESLATDLRSSGSVLSLIESVMSSGYYSKENYK